MRYILLMLLLNLSVTLAQSSVPEQVQELMSMTYAEAVPCSAGMVAKGYDQCYIYPYSWEVFTRDVEGAVQSHTGHYPTPDRTMLRFEISGNAVILQYLDGFVGLFVNPS